MNSGATQVTSKKILIFGGLVEEEEDDKEGEFAMTDNGQSLKLTDASWFLDVTKGSIKRGPSLLTPSYYVSNSGSLICIDNQLYA
mmetsp:Transcript_7737/g.12985  ORF Transcript_7737/g.12985 Transcript_7737/m.12985 type:complete len:85 (-) Transcript_7737:646-900(-)